MTKSQVQEVDEDAPRTVIYVDMLGFAALTETFRTRVIREGAGEYGFLSSFTSPIQNQINQFYTSVDRCVFNESLYGRLFAMLFSDCAFLEAGNAIAGALLAIEIMRECIKARVPVRMGIGRGTFYPLTLSTNLTGSVQISRCRFVGTAVVYAHAAEQSGGKGMRIFLHPSAVPDLQGSSSRVRTLPLPKPFPNAAWELDYLYEPTAFGATPSADVQDRGLFGAVSEMNDPAAPMKVRRQYIETLKALNRMRTANSRRTVSGRRK